MVAKNYKAGLIIADISTYKSLKDTAKANTSSISG